MSEINPAMLLTDAIGNTLELPEGFGVSALAPASLGLNAIPIIGRDGAVMDHEVASLAPKDIEIRGMLVDKALNEAGSFQAARAAALADYHEIMGFLNNARQYGLLKIEQEQGIVLDPAGVGYVAALAPLGYFIEGYFKGGSAPVSWGIFGRGALDLALQFTCPRPYWQGFYNATSLAGSVGDGHSITKAFTVLGTVAARPQFILYSAAGLSVAAEKEITLTIAALSVSWTGTISAASYLVFDCETGQVFETAALPATGKVSWDGASATNKASGLTDTADWAALQWAFATGSHSLVVSSDITSAANLTAHIRFANEYYG